MNITSRVVSLDDKISTIISILVKPNSTFRKITENQQSYFVSGIAILVVSSFFFISYGTFDDPEFSLPTNELGYVLDPKYQTASFGWAVLLNVVFIVLVFYIGKKFGGSGNFGKLFSVMAFAMIPSLIGGIMMHSFLTYPPLLESITGMDAENPEFAGLFWPIYFAFIPFVIWTLVLTIKAIKIANDFGTAKAFGILMLSSIVIYVADSFVPFLQWV